MSPADVHVVLAYASAIDPRVRRNDQAERQLQVAAWAAQLDGYNAADAKAAVDRHYAAADPPALLPGRLRSLIAAIRAERITAQPEAIPDADPDDDRAYRAALRAGRTRLANGTEQPRPVAALISRAFRGVE